MKVSILHKIKYLPEISIVRGLPYPGNIHVKVGDHVQPYDHIASAKVSYLNTALTYTGKAIVKVGDYVKGGNQLALGGWWHRKPTLNAPFAGMVESIDEHNHLLKLASTKRDFFLTAGFTGTVAKIDPLVGVTITTAAMQLKGVLGLGSGSGKIILAKDLNNDNGLGKLVWTTFLDLALISKAQALGVAGVIANSIDWEGFLALRQKSEMGFLLLTGFDQMSINANVELILKQVLGCFAQIDGPAKTLTVPKEELASRVTDHQPLMKQLAVGDSVVVYFDGYFAHEGKVIELYDALHRFESGLLAAAVKVRLNDGVEVVVPAEQVGVLV